MATPFTTPFTVAPFVWAHRYSSAGVTLGATYRIYNVTTTGFDIIMDLLAPTTATYTPEWAAQA